MQRKEWSKCLKLNGGEYRTRTGVHGFAKLGMHLNYGIFLLRGQPNTAGTLQESLDGLLLALDTPQDLHQVVISSQ